MVLSDTKELIYKRITAIKHYLSILEKYKDISPATLKADYEKSAIVERYFQLVIEASIGIAELIISDQNFPVAETSREAIQILGKKGVINNQFSEQFCGVAGFRNVLVHDYLDIDYEKVANYLKNNLADFHRFIKEVVMYLK